MTHEPEDHYVQKSPAGEHHCFRIINPQSCNTFLRQLAGCHWPLLGRMLAAHTRVMAGSRVRRESPDMNSL
jgi:hypothetical protein